MDSFQLLSKQQYSLLCEQLKEDSPRSLKIINILTTVTSTSTEECYIRRLEDGNVDASTVILKKLDAISFLGDNYGKSITIYCKIPELLPEVLSSCNLIDWSDLHLIMDVSEEDLHFYHKASEQHNGKYIEYGMNAFYLPDPTHLPEDLTIPEDVELIQLTPEMVDTVRNHWRYGRFYSKEDLTSTLTGEQGRGMALVKKTNPKEMISWIGLNQYGRIGFLHTLQEHRKKGYGNIIANRFIKQMLKEDRIPTCHILPGNKNSENMFFKLGFKLETGRPNFILFYTPNTEEGEAKYRRVLKEFEKIDFKL